MSKESEIMREHIRTHRTVLSICNEPEDVILKRLLDDFDRKDQRIAELEARLMCLKNNIIDDETLKELVKEHRLYKDLEAKLAESENKLNQYPYKNDVIEKQYEDLKDGIRFRVANNITNDWEQLYHSIDVLCEKHKARIRDIENSICSIEQLKQQLAEKERKLQEAMTNCVNLANTRAISNLNKVQDRIDDMKSRYDLDIEYHLGANNELTHLWEFIDQLTAEIKGEK